MPEVDSIEIEFQCPSSMRRMRAQAMLDEGKKTFRYETCGSETFWGDALLAA